MILTCSCGAVNRLPSIGSARVRCAKCKHEFTPKELVKATPEAPPGLTRKGGMEFELEMEDDVCLECGKSFDACTCDEEDIEW